MFADRLISAVSNKNNPTVAGLDPRLEYIPKFILDAAIKDHGKGFDAAGAAIFEYNRGLIDAFYDIIPAVKPQLAYYEMYGLPGLKAFADTVNYAKSKGLIVIADGKRNDIGATSAAYATAYLGVTDLFEENARAFDADALTVSPYLGSDGVLPFVKECKTNGTGIFVLVKTSNPSSKELQDLELGDSRKIYEIMASYVDKWGEDVVGESGYSSVGAVVGATFPGEAQILRGLLLKSILLVPGYGAQGGGAADVVPCFDQNGRGAIVNASRSIMCAYKSAKWASFGEEGYAEAARAECVAMRDDINRALEIN